MKEQFITRRFDAGSLAIIVAAVARQQEQRQKLHNIAANMDEDNA